jgi:NTE family protein
MAVLTGEPRSATVIAIRDTVLAHATREVFEALCRRRPELSLHMTRIVINRFKRRSVRPRVGRPSTICVLAITDGVDALGFADRLASGLDRWGVTTVESSDRVDGRFGRGTAKATAEQPEAFKLTRWLDDLEFWNQFVLLVADDGDSDWTRRCLRHADKVFLLARADAPVGIRELERRLCMGEGAITGALQTLVLLHGRDTAHPKGTAAWLDRRPVDSHHHVRLDAPRDMTRLARILSGNAIGLVLGGGGARGFAHLGVYKALEELGVEVDLVAGTSIGAAMGAIISLDLKADALIDIARKTFRANPTSDYNVLPLLSLFKGRKLQRSIDRALIEATGHEADVADSWKTLRCVATNYSRACEKVIGRGPIGRTVRASVSIPAALPPVPWEGDLLIDGGVFNNFPTTVMTAMGARRIIGVDVSSRKARVYEHAEIPGTLELLRDRLRGSKRRKYRLPNLATVLMTTTILYSESQREQAKQSVDIYVNPPLSGVPLLEWKAFDRIVDIGYESARQVLSSMSDEELAPYRND